MSEPNEQIYQPKKVDICSTHGKNNWKEHAAYINNNDGTISCQYCGWGSKIPGYMRVLDGKLIDLRA